MSKRARQVESDQKGYGIPTENGWDPTWVKRYICFQRRVNPRIQGGPKPKQFHGFRPLQGRQEEAACPSFVV